MRVRRWLLILLFLLVLFIIFHNIFIIIFLLILILLYNKIKLYIKLYRVYGSLEREAVAISTALLAAIFLLRGAPAVKIAALALGATSMLIAPFYPSAALAMSAFGLTAEMPVSGLARAASLALAVVLGYLAGLKVSRSGLTRIYSYTLEPRLEELKYDVIVKGPDAFYALSRGGEIAKGDFVFFVAHGPLLYRCRKPRCLPLSVKSGEEALKEFISLLNEYSYLLFPQIKNLENSLIIYTNKENFSMILSKLGRAYILSPRGAPSATANVRDVPTDKALKAVDLALKAAGVWSRELLQEAYLFLTRGGPADPQIPGVVILRDLLKGLDAWPDAVAAVELGEDPRSLLIAYLLQAKFGGYIVTFSERLFNLLREEGAANVVLITDKPTSAKADYIVVGPYAGSLQIPFGRYAEKLREGEYVGLVGGVPVHGFLWGKN